MAISGIIRGFIRALVRAGRDPASVRAATRAAFGWEAPRSIATATREEFARQAVADTVMNADKRRRIDLGTVAGCPASASQVRVGVTISFVDPATGLVKNRSDSYVTERSGRLADLLNSVLGQTIEAAGRSGSPTPEVTSAMTSGRTRYTIDYVRCVR